MTYPRRTLCIHVLLLMVVVAFFILPVVFDTPALLPVWVSAGIGFGVGAVALIDAVFKFFLPQNRPARALRIISACASLFFIVGWTIWLFIYGNAAAGTGLYRAGTFFLSAGTVLSLFTVAIATLDMRAR